MYNFSIMFLCFVSLLYEHIRIAINAIIFFNLEKFDYLLVKLISAHYYIIYSFECVVYSLILMNAYWLIDFPYTKHYILL